MKLDPDIFIHVSIHNNFIDYCSQLEYDALNPNNIFILSDQYNEIHKPIFFDYSIETLDLSLFEYKSKILKTTIEENEILLEKTNYQFLQYLVIKK